MIWRAPGTELGFWLSVTRWTTRRTRREDDEPVEYFAADTGCASPLSLLVRLRPYDEAKQSFYMAKS